MSKLIGLVSLLFATVSFGQNQPLRIYNQASTTPLSLAYRLRMTGSGVNCVYASGMITCTIAGGGGGAITVAAPITGDGSSGTPIACPSCITGSPSATGDMLYSTSGGQAMSLLAIGTSGKFIKSTGSAPSWANIAESDVANLTTDLAAKLNLSGGTMSGAITFSGTQIGTYSLGGTPTLAASLAIGTTATYAVGDTTHLLTTVATAKVIGGSSNTSGHTVPNAADDTFALIAASQTLTNKTITAPVFSGTSSGTYTLAGTLTLTAPIINGATSASGNFDLSGSSGTFKTTTGAHTFGSASWAIPANTVITAAAASTNTVGATIVSNVADGAASVGLLINNTTALPTTGSAVVRISSNGTQIYDFRPSGVIYGKGGGHAFAQLDDSTGTSLKYDTTGYTAGVYIANTATILANNTQTVHFSSAGEYPNTDSGFTLGKASQRYTYAVYGAAVASQPTCDATTRGLHITIFATAGNPDTEQVCMKKTDNSYAYLVIGTSP